MSQNKAVLIYVGDPMCSWCYGFSPEITKVKEALKNECDFKLVMGGLRPFNTETMADLGDFLKGHWEHVAERSPVEFNYEILNDKSFVYDTEPPARAVVVVRNMKPSVEFDFFKEVQSAFYAGNKNTNDIQTYLDLLTQFDLDKKTFTALYESENMKKATKADYQLAQSLGVHGFPGTILYYQGNYYRTSNGYLKAEELISAVRLSLSESK